MTFVLVFVMVFFVVFVFVLLVVALYWDIFDGSGPASRAVEAARSDGRIENNGNNQKFNICKTDTRGKILVGNHSLGGGWSESSVEI